MKKERKEVAITIRCNPTGVQQVSAVENCECLKKFGGRYDGFLWDNNGVDIIAVLWGDSEIQETLRIHIDDEHIPQVQIQAIEFGFS